MAAQQVDLSLKSLPGLRFSAPKNLQTSWSFLSSGTSTIETF
jgi:hypothetical protein